MHFSSLAAFTCLVISASAFDYPEFVPLHRRQEPGTPAYECHANCGGVIVSARSNDFCDSSTFKSQLSDCLKCANEFDIWKYYGDKVSKAAKSCGLDATPEDGGDKGKDDNSTIVQPAPITSAEPSAESSASATEPPTKAGTTSAEASETTALGTTASSASQSFTTTASVTTSHPVIPTGSKSTPVSGSSTPTGQATASASSSEVPLSNSASSAEGNLWMGVVAGSLIAAVMGI